MNRDKKNTILDAGGKPISIDEEQLKEQEITKEELKEYIEMVRRLMFQLYMKHPFYALILEKCKLYFTNKIPTAGVTENGCLYVNGQWLSKLSPVQQLFLMAHEALHLAYMHIPRKGLRDHEMWNKAADVMINWELVKDFERHGDLHVVLPPGGIYTSNVNRDITTEDVYAILHNQSLDKQQQQGKRGQKGGQQKQQGQSAQQGQQGKSGQQGQQQQGQGNQPGRSSRGDSLSKSYPDLDKDLQGISNMPAPSDLMKEDIDGSTLVRGNSEETPETKEEWQEATQQALTRAKLQGKAPAGMGMEIGQLLKPKIKWTTQLIAKMTMEVCTVNKTDYTWRHPQRRFFHEDLILPGMTGVRNRIATAVDTSGSMYDNWHQACGEVEGVRKHYKAMCYHMWCDAKVDAVGWLKPEDRFPETAFGGGGTSFIPVFEHIEEELDNNIDCLVFFTDLWGSFPKEAPPYRMIWVTYSNEIPPWGELVVMTEH